MSEDPPPGQVPEEPQQPTSRWWQNPRVLVPVAIVVVFLLLAVLIGRGDGDADVDVAQAVGTLTVEAPDSVEPGEPFTATAIAVGADDRPVGEVEVELEVTFLDEDETVGQTSTLTDAEGRAMFTDLTLNVGGTYRLMATADGAQGRATVAVPDREPDPGPEAAQVSFSEIPDAVMANEQFAFVVSVEGPDGEPLADAEVEVVPDEPFTPEHPRVVRPTDADGEATFEVFFDEPGQRELVASSGDAADTAFVAVLEPEPDPRQARGDGPTVVGPFSHRGGLARFELRHTGREDFVVRLLDANDEPMDTLVDAVGAVETTVQFGLAAGEYSLEVLADGSWTVDFLQPRPMHGQALPVELAGGQTGAPEPFEIAEDTTVDFALTHAGRGPFVVTLYTADGDRVAVLADGSGDVNTQATEDLEQGVYVLDVRAGGTWTISIGPS